MKKTLLLLSIVLMFMAPVFADREIIQSQSLENCNINDKILRYVKIVNCHITNSEVYSAEIIDSQVTNSDIHEVDVRHSILDGGILRSIYTTEGSVVRNADIWTSTIEGTYVDHTSGGQITVRNGDVSDSSFNQANVQNASVTDSQLNESTTNSVEIRTSPKLPAENTMLPTHPESRIDIAIKTGSISNDSFTQDNSSRASDTEYVIQDDNRPETHSNPQLVQEKRGFWKEIFCNIPLFNSLLSC